VNAYSSIHGCKINFINLNAVSEHEREHIINTGIYVVLCASQYADTPDTGSDIVNSKGAGKAGGCNAEWYDRCDEDGGRWVRLKS
jgi:hypothetical protein